MHQFITWRFKKSFAKLTIKSFDVLYPFLNRCQSYKTFFQFTGEGEQISWSVCQCQVWYFRVGPEPTESVPSTLLNLLENIEFGRTNTLAYLPPPRQWQRIKKLFNKLKMIENYKILSHSFSKNWLTPSQIGKGKLGGEHTHANRGRDWESNVSVRKREREWDSGIVSDWVSACEKDRKKESERKWEREREI